MKRILIAYTSRAGTTEKMANYLAEGVRMSGNETEVSNGCDGPWSVKSDRSDDENG